MSRPTLDRKSILFVVAGLLLVAVLAKYGMFGGGQDASAVAPADSVQVAEKRLEILRQKAATVPGRETVLHQVQAELAQREKGIVIADTAEQARAHLMLTLHSVAAANGFDASGADTLPQPKPLGKDYGQVSVGQNFICGIDQLVNFLAAIANWPDILATESIYIGTLNKKEKTVQVRLTLSGVVPRKLVPEKKGLASF
jgi:hypothetical protein